MRPRSAPSAREPRGPGAPMRQSAHARTCRSSRRQRLPSRDRRLPERPRRSPHHADRHGGLRLPAAAAIPPAVSAAAIPISAAPAAVPGLSPPAARPPAAAVPRAGARTRALPDVRTARASSRAGSDARSDGAARAFSRAHPRPHGIELPLDPGPPRAALSERRPVRPPPLQHAIRQVRLSLPGADGLLVEQLHDGRLRSPDGTLKPRFSGFAGSPAHHECACAHAGSHTRNAVSFDNEWRFSDCALLRHWRHPGMTAFSHPTGRGHRSCLWRAA
jgi:hypothetical protein